MSELQTHKQALKEKIDEMEAKLEVLRGELQKKEEIEQHEAIDQLDLHYSDLATSFNTLKEFMDILRDEFKKTFR